MSKKKSEDKKSSEYISEFLAFVRFVQSEYELSYNTVNDYDKATSDILHQFELGPAKERGKFGTMIARIRKDRRVYKDFVDVHERLYKYIKEDPNFKTVYRQLEQILGDIRKNEKNLESKRAYRPRVLDSLTIRTTKEEG